MFISQLLAIVAVYAGFSTYEKIPDTQKYNDSYIISVPGIVQDDSHSCGFWTLFHAKALQKCIDETGSIDMNLIQRYAKEYEMNITEELLPSDLVQQHATNLLELQNLDVIIRQPRTGEISLEETNQKQLDILIDTQIEEEEKKTRLLTLESNISQEVNNKLTDIKNNLLQKSDYNKMHHFACLLNGHWVLMTMLKLSNRNAIDIVYMDSLDKPIGSNGARHYYLHFFKRKFLDN